MTRPEARERSGRGAARPLDLIHRSNCSKPGRGRRPATVSYRIEECGPAVLGAVLLILEKLERGGYGTT